MMYESAKLQQKVFLCGQNQADQISTIWKKALRAQRKISRSVELNSI